MMEYAQDMNWVVNQFNKRWPELNAFWTHTNPKYIFIISSATYTARQPAVKIPYGNILKLVAETRPPHKIDEDVSRRWMILHHVELELELKYKYGK